LVLNQITGIEAERIQALTSANRGVTAIRELLLTFIGHESESVYRVDVVPTGDERLPQNDGGAR